MPEHHHGAFDMHMPYSMWHYFGLHHWGSWIILVAVIAVVVYALKARK